MSSHGFKMLSAAGSQPFVWPHQEASDSSECSKAYHYTASLALFLRRANRVCIIYWRDSLINDYLLHQTVGSWKEGCVCCIQNPAQCLAHSNRWMNEWMNKWRNIVEQPLAALGRRRVLWNSFTLMYCPSFTSMILTETRLFLSCLSRGKGGWHWYSHAQSKPISPFLLWTVPGTVGGTWSGINCVSSKVRGCSPNPQCDCIWS